MRIAKPHWKESHKCWYVKLKGKFHRLDPDKQKAFDAYADLLGKRNIESGATAAGSIKVADLAYLFLEWVDKHNANYTYLWYRKYLHGINGKTGKHKSDGFANFISPDLRVVDLRPYHVTNWLDSRYLDASDNTRAGAITAILRLFNWAREQGYIDHNPLGKMRKPNREARDEDAYLQPHQWDQLIDAVKAGQKQKEVQPFLDYITVIKETGCRPQEIRKVEARHLDHELKRWIFPVKESKGKKDKREVLLGPIAYEICARLAKANPDGPIFRNSDGKPWTNFAVSCRFKRLSKILGFTVYAYAVRHSFASEAIINGVDIITIARLMGHKDLTMLNKIYQHVTKDRGHMETARKRATERLAV